MSPSHAVACQPARAMQAPGTRARPASGKNGTGGARRALAQAQHAAKGVKEGQGGEQWASEVSRQLGWKGRGQSHSVRGELGACRQRRAAGRHLAVVLSWQRHVSGQPAGEEEARGHQCPPAGCQQAATAQHSTATRHPAAAIEQATSKAKPHSSTCPHGTHRADTQASLQASPQASPQASTQAGKAGN